MVKNIEEFKGDEQRQILTAMATDNYVITQIASCWHGPMFSEKWCNEVGKWCVNHFRNYGEPIGQSTEGVFRIWAEKTNDLKVIEMMEKFLTHLSHQYEHKVELNSQFVVDMATRHFQRVRLAKLADEIDGHLSGGDVDKADAVAQSYSRINLGESAHTDLLTDEGEVADAFEELSEGLVSYSEGLEHFFAGELGRDAFVSFLAPEKAGKTFWLIDVAWRAVRSGKRVAFFEVGDMSKRQIKRRFLTRIARKPIRSPDGKLPYVVKWPTFIAPPEGEAKVAEVNWRPKTFDKLLNKEDAWSACQRLASKQGESLFKLAVYSAHSVDVLSIRAVLENWIRLGWIPDVVVIDYADILAPLPKTVNRDKREQIDETWQEMRGMSQDLHCLVMTATQADARSYDQKGVLDRRNFSESKTKMAHVTGMVGINVNSDEKKAGVCRLNWVVLREGDFSPTKCCHVAGCLPLAIPSVKSTF